MDSIEIRKQYDIEPEDLTCFVVIEDEGPADSRKIYARRDGVGAKVASTLAWPRVNMDQWRAARALLQAGQVETALQAYAGSGIKPKSESILKRGDSLREGLKN